MQTHKEDNILRVLRHENLRTESEIQTLQQRAKLSQQTLFQYISQHQIIPAEKFLSACAAVFQLPVMSLENINITTLECLPPHMIKNNLWLCVTKKPVSLVIAICDPSDMDTVKSLSFQLNAHIELVFARYDIAHRLHTTYFSKKLYQDANQPAQIIAHHLLSTAIHQHASDIHIEPYRQYCRIRFRIDGLLREITRFSHTLTDAIISCLKVLAQLDIAIKRMPQDGRLSFRTDLGFLKDCRVSTCPTLHGEKIVIRLLDAETQIRNIAELGLKPRDQKIIFDIMKQPQGLILVTGPTGSGKTITLYSLLQLLNQQDRNIATIEDPVEMQIEGINQTHVNPKNGLTFSHTLRTLLRQDPDVMMIGEIRDQETAEMAIRAAQTGHLVLSTLHTNSAAEAITRLHHMGIAPFHLSSALTLVIAQRLVRKCCHHCNGLRACTHCHDGFLGRIGIFELLPVNTEIKELIATQRSHIQIAKKNREAGNLNLWESAQKALKTGITSLNEIYRVIPYEQHIA